jgi:hypothetical protein
MRFFHTLASLSGSGLRNEALSVVKEAAGARKRLI